MLPTIMPGGITPLERFGRFLEIIHLPIFRRSSTLCWIESVVWLTIALVYKDFWSSTPLVEEPAPDLLHCLWRDCLLIMGRRASLNSRFTPLLRYIFFLLCSTEILGLHSRRGTIQLYSDDAYNPGAFGLCVHGWQWGGRMEKHF